MAINESGRNAGNDSDAADCDVEWQKGTFRFLGKQGLATEVCSRKHARWYVQRDMV